MEKTENIVPEFSQTEINSDVVFRISEEFERDCRRYNRAFLDEQEVGTR
ncbi:MAG: hypothetical protein IJD68_08110 [Ruminococcus sp.]|nr:hypothetical protein [Ruminococcus sp.]